MKYNIDKIVSIVKKWSAKDLSVYEKLGKSYYGKKISDIERSSQGKH